MPYRGTVSQIVQVGFESTPGTLAAATKRFSGARIMPSAKPAIETFRPSASLYPTVAILNSDHTEAAIEGKALYDEIIVFLASIFKVVTPTTPVGATNARLWTFDPSAAGGDTVKTLTIEAGDAIRALRFGNARTNSFGISWARKGDGVAINGSMLGAKINRGFTLTSGGVTQYPDTPIQPGHVDVFLDATAAGLGTTQLAGAFSASFSVENRFAPVFPLNSSVPSFDGVVEIEPAAQVSLGLSADTTGEEIAYLYESGDTRYLRVEAVGPEIDSGIAASAYRLTVDAAIKVTDPGEYSDDDGVWIIPPTFTIVKAPSWSSGKAFEIAVVNTQTALA